MRHAWIRSVLPLTLADLRHRYAGSALGGFWTIAAPLLEVAAYALVFGFLLPSATRGSGLHYALFIASGLLPWAAFREALEASAATLPDNRWIRRSRVPLELLVARHVLVAASRAVVGLVLVIGTAFLVQGWAGFAALSLVLLALVLQVAMCYGLGLALAPLGTLYPDLRPGLSSALLLLTFASPILYPESVLGPRALALVEWNPFTYLLRLYRLPLALDHFHGPDVAWCLAAAAVLVGVGVLVKDRYWWSARDAL